MTPSFKSLSSLTRSDLKALTGLTLPDDQFIQGLPCDPVSENSARHVEKAYYSHVTPATAPKPQLIAYTDEVAELLQLRSAFCDSDEFVELLSGNRSLPNLSPYATRYGGHQFGHWAGQLGDGRAINLGDVMGCEGQPLAIQLKGAGPTPYARRGDGFAVLRSSIREFLCSEAMHHLGIPTTRALSLIKTGRTVVRDMFYDGHPKAEQGAVVCRVAPSFIRFGHFQILAANREFTLMRQLLDKCLTWYPFNATFNATINAVQARAYDSHDYIEWFTQLCRVTAELMVKWMSVGFVHGVMNTDNMSIHGITIDYGPYGWLDQYDPQRTPNTTDAEMGRYAYQHQPSIAQWNLAQLANALYPIVQDADALNDALNHYTALFEQGWQAICEKKLGLSSTVASHSEGYSESYSEGYSVEWLQSLWGLLDDTAMDMTLFFRQLSQVSRVSECATALLQPLLKACYQPERLIGLKKDRLVDWLRTYLSYLPSDKAQDEARKSAMNAVNPKYILRNYMVQSAIEEAEQGSFDQIDSFLKLIRKPYDEQPEYQHFYQKRPEWARNKPGCSALSCSS